MKVALFFSLRCVIQGVRISKYKLEFCVYEELETFGANVTRIHTYTCLLTRTHTHTHTHTHMLLHIIHVLCTCIS